MLKTRFYDLDEGVKKATGIINLEIWPEDKEVTLKGELYKVNLTLYLLGMKSSIIADFGECEV